MFNIKKKLYITPSFRPILSDTVNSVIHTVIHTNAYVLSFIIFNSLLEKII